MKASAYIREEGWDGIYLDLRKDLLDHIIECLKQTLKHKETHHD